ncbi:DNA polymerase eta-like [Ptychodera flava]|uniref:DNA polymerase eta-like n=1 Tax=Ptychodera flava TaxID=63121 RepID=UPI003969C66A
MDRVIALVDMDCFYVQVEQRRNPALKGKPCAVVQYKTWKGGGIIAVGYEARAHGVTRNMRGDEAKEKCPDIALVRVPENRGKADLTRYRNACVEVIEVLCKFSKSVERASVDEAYIDLSDEVHKRIERLENQQISIDMLPNTHIVDWNINEDTGVTDGNTGQTEPESAQDKRVAELFQWLDSYGNKEDKRLAIGGLIAEEMRAAVFQETGFRCSAGVAHNKVLAKLACGLHKPNQQTILPHRSVQKLYRTMPINKVRHFGGKLGQQLQDELGMQYMADIGKLTLKQLQSQLGDKTGAWLYEIGRGIEHEPVRPRQLTKSVGCGKNFPGKTSLATKQQVKHWLLQLSLEIEERLVTELDMNKRSAKLLTVSVRMVGTPPQSASRSFKLVSTNAESIARSALAVIQCFNVAGNHQGAWSPPILTLSLSASKFNDTNESSTQSATSTSSIGSFFTSRASSSSELDLPGPSQSIESRVAEKSGHGKKKKRNSIESFFAPSQKKLKTVDDGNELKTANDGSDNCMKGTGSVHSGDAANGGDCSEITSGSTSNVRRHGFFASKSKSDVCIGGEKPMSSSVSQQEDCVSNTVISTPNLDEDSDDGDLITYNFKTNAPTVASESISSDKQNNTGSTSDGGAALFPDDQDTGKHVTQDTKCDADVVECDKCGNMVSVWELPEHLDFHFAMDIQAQMNSQPPVHTNGVAPSVANVGKKLGASGKAGQNSKKKSKASTNSTLHSFFKRKTDTTF